MLSLGHSATSGQPLAWETLLGCFLEVGQSADTPQTCWDRVATFLSHFPGAVL